MANLFGTGINQAPLNGMLGNLAFQDKAFVSVDKIGIGTTAVDTGTANQTLQNYGGAFISGSVGIGTTNPTSTFSVNGNGLFTGIVTASNFSGSVTGGIGSFSQLQVTGVSTFTNGPVLVGSATSTGTASQPLQVTGGAYVSGNLGIGTTNPQGTLQVNGTRILHSLSGINTVEFGYSAGSGDSNAYGLYVPSGRNFYLYGNNTFQLSATSTGVGIGTTNPGYKLDVSGQARIAGDFHISGSSVIDGIGQDLFLQGNSGYGIIFRTNGANERGRFNSTGNLLIGTTSDTGTASQRLQVTGGAYISSNTGIGTTNPQYIFTVTDTGTPATTGLTNCLADFTTTANSYGQINLRNTSTGTNASSDIIVTADNGSDTTNFIDLGINNSGFSVGSWTINGANDGYLYTSDGNLSIGAINASVAKYISFFTGGTLLSNERMRINAIGVGIGSTNPTSRLDVVGDGKFTGIVTASQFSTGSGTLGFTTNTINGPSEIIIDPLPVGVGTTSGIVRIRGDLYVDGTQFIVNSTTIELADLRVGIATTIGTNLLLDGGGIGIGSANIIKTITWNNTASALTSSEDWNLVSGKQYEINGTSVLSSTTLGSGVVNSSLTSVGTLGQLQVTGISTFTNGPVFIGSGTSTGTTSQPLQVTGGAYVSGNIGAAVTSPSFAVDVSGDARVQSTGKMRFGGTAGTTNFYIQYNSTANSLDFVAG